MFCMTLYDRSCSSSQHLVYPMFCSIFIMFTCLTSHTQPGWLLAPYQVQTCSSPRTPSFASKGFAIFARPY